MSRFVQMHILTAYPPSNPNRDDLGRPKTAIIGGVSRMRISSQSLKRAIRTDDAFRSALTGSLGERTQRMGDKVRSHLLEQGASDDKALEIARNIAALFGKIKGERRESGLYRTASLHLAGGTHCCIRFGRKGTERGNLTEGKGTGETGPKYR